MSKWATFVPRNIELDEYIEYVEAMAHDDEYEPSPRQRGLLKKFAHQGAWIGWNDRGPDAISVDATWLEAAVPR